MRKPTPFISDLKCASVHGPTFIPYCNTCRPSPLLQTFYRLEGVQSWDGLMVDEIIVLLGRIVPGGWDGAVGTWVVSGDPEPSLPCGPPQPHRLTFPQ